MNTKNLSFSCDQGMLGLLFW